MAKTLKDLREFIKDLLDDAEIEIAIKQYNKCYPIAYSKVWQITESPTNMVIRLYASLPDNIYTVEKKQK